MAAESKNYDSSKDEKRLIFEKKLIQHIYMNENIHVCPICKKSFASRCALIDHKLVHKGEKNHECWICDKAFSRKSNLTLHQANVHPQKQNSTNLEILKDPKKPGDANECSMCKKVFLTLRALSTHTGRMHPEMRNTNCNVCHTKFSTKEQLIRHKLTHGIQKSKCSVCGKKFMYKRSLLTHEMTHMNRENVSDEGNWSDDKGTHANGDDSFSESKAPKQQENIHGEMEAEQGITEPTLPAKKTIQPNVLLTQILKKAQGKEESNKKKVESSNCKDSSLTKELCEGVAGPVLFTEDRNGTKKMKKQAKKFFKVLREHYPEHGNESFDYSVFRELETIGLSEQHPMQWRFNCHLISANNAKRILSPSNYFMDSMTANLEMWDFQCVNQSAQSIPQLPLFITHIVMALGSCFKQFSDSGNCMVDSEVINVALQANCRNEVMAVLGIQNHGSAFKKILRDFVLFKSVQSLKIKSLYLQISQSSPELFYGAEKLEAKIGSLEMDISVDVILSSELERMTVIAKGVEKYFKPNSRTTLVEIGCESGFNSLLQANKFRRVIGCGSAHEIKTAETMRSRNGITNAFFVGDNLMDTENLFKKLENYKKVVAVINHTTDCGRSTFAAKSIRKLKCLRRVLVATPLTNEYFQPLLELMKPKKDTSGTFKIARSSVVERISESQGRLYFLFLERV